MAQSKLPPEAQAARTADIRYHAKTEGTRTADLAHERIREVHRVALTAGIDRRMVKVDGEISVKPLYGLNSAHLSPSSANGHNTLMRTNFLAQFSSSIPASSSR